MSTLTVYNVSAINTPEVNYTDNLLRVNQRRLNYEQGFYLNYVSGLSGCLDSSINNYTSHYLTNNINFNDLLTVNEKLVPLETITTTLIFNYTKTFTENRYLYIYKNSDSEDPDLTTCRALISSFVGFQNNIYFELEFLNNTYIRVKHNNGVKDYYMNVLPGYNTIGFIHYTSENASITYERSDIFRYYLDPKGYLQLYKRTPFGMQVVTFEEHTGKLILVPFLENRTLQNTYIKINNNFTDINPELDTSWVGYKKMRRNNLEIDTNRSTFNRKNQYLLHTNYNTKSAIQLEYLPLNNIRSEKNFIKRGSSLEYGTFGYPDVGFRNYTTLQTGHNQEKGNDNITLVYTWYDKDIYVRSGTDTYFTAPSSLYPFVRVNINDTKFTLNGSFAGKSPLLSDRVLSYRDATVPLGNGRYLCTWLSGGGDLPGVWVDRYYYPDLTTKQNALSGITVYTPSFFDPIDNVDYAEKVSLSKREFFDKKSDLCLTPNTRYVYSRISEDEVNNIISTSNPLASGFDGFFNRENRFVAYEDKEIIYDGAKFNRFNVSRDINAQHSFTVSFDAYVDPNKKYGYQLLGNLTDRGFGIINDEKVTPFIYIQSDYKIFVYSTIGALINTIEFDEYIIDIITPGGLGDFFVICSGGVVYKLNTVGNKKKKEVDAALAEYINFWQTDKEIIFLPIDRGDCIRVNKNTLEITRASLFTYNSVKRQNIYSIVEYNNTVYGLPGQKIKSLNSEEVFYSINDNTIIKHNLRTGYNMQYIAMDSESKIIDFAVSTDNELIVLYDTTLIAVFDASRKLKNVYSLFDSDSDTGVDIVPIETQASFTLNSVDVVREYVGSEGLKEYYVVSFIDNNNNLGFKYLTSEGFFTEFAEYFTTNIPMKKNNIGYSVPYPARNKSNLTGFNYFKQLPDFSGFDFKILLNNYLNTEDIVSRNIRISFADIDVGYHTFTYIFDSVTGLIKLFVDGVLKEIQTVPPGKYKIQSIFNDDIYVGAAGFYNGIDLSTYLLSPGAFLVKDLKIKNLFFYNRPVSDIEVDALDLYGEVIDDIVLSIPAGQRNNIEEIERYFKYSNKTSSKMVNIYITNTGILNNDIQNNIKNMILSEARRSLPVGVVINDIQFADFK